MPDSLPYFAYGSNMSLARLRNRVSNVEPVGLALLKGHQLRFHKRGRDGSAKCDAHFTGDDDQVFGVLFLLDPSDRSALDAFEGVGAGYDARTVSVQLSSGGTRQALSYCATDIDASLKPYCWYRHHVVTGAREFGLPPGYVADIEAIPVIADQDTGRLSREYAPYLQGLYQMGEL